MRIQLQMTEENIKDLQRRSIEIQRHTRQLILTVVIGILVVIALICVGLSNIAEMIGWFALAAVPMMVINNHWMRESFERIKSDLFAQYLREQVAAEEIAIGSEQKQYVVRPARKRTV